MKQKLSSRYTCVTAVNSGRRKKIGIVFAAVLLCLGCFFINRWVQSGEETFAPPPFEAEAKEGEPTPPQDLGYTEISVEQGYSVKLCGRLFCGGGKLPIFVTNPEANQVWIMAEILDGDEVLAKSGVLKPGEYAENLDMLKMPDKEDIEVKVKISAFEPDTFISKGNAVITTHLYKDTFQGAES